MEKHYIKRENDLHQSVGIKAINKAQKNRAEVKARLSTKEGRTEAMNRIFSKDV